MGTELTNEELFRLSSTDPRVLWKLLTSELKVAGPWVPAFSKKRNFGVGGEALWRLDPTGEDVVVVHKWWEHCDGASKPNPGMYDYGTEDEDYIRDLEKFKRKDTQRAGREWVYRVEGKETEYASTKEEALLLASEYLRVEGFLLLDELTPDQLETYLE